MDGLTFTTAQLPATDPSRMDIACFVGFVGRRGSVETWHRRLMAALRELGWKGPDLPRDRRLVPPGVGTGEGFAQWLRDLGWISDPGPGVKVTPAARLFDRALSKVMGTTLVDWWTTTHRLSAAPVRDADDYLSLLDLPVPIDAWDAFDALFAWDEREVTTGGRHADTWMGAAVRRFFAMGGKKCYVVRLGDPVAVLAPIAERAGHEQRFLPKLPPPSPVDRSSWKGIGHLFGLPDVSFLCLPDWPELFSVEPMRLATKPDELPTEIFIECADRIEPPGRTALRGIPAPRCDASGFKSWARGVREVAASLDRYAMDVQLIASVPLPIDESVVSRAGDSAHAMHAAAQAQWEEARLIHTRSVQLAYPWLRTRESGLLPGGLEPPDGALAGLLAENALVRSTWRSAIHLPAAGIAGVEPQPDRELQNRTFAPPLLSGFPLTLRDRISLFGPAPRGFRLLSDVTTAGGFHREPRLDEAYRPANVNRLLAVLLRTARRLGDEVVFDNNGEALWGRIRGVLEGLLARLWADGALAGASSKEAFEVRCDRSTMTQADIDAGRVITRVSFAAAMPIVHITVVFAMEEGAGVTLRSTRLEAASLEAA